MNKDMNKDEMILLLYQTIAWELNILEIEVRPVIKPSRRDWLNRRIKRLRNALDFKNEQ